MIFGTGKTIAKPLTFSLTYAILVDRGKIVQFLQLAGIEIRVAAQVSVSGSPIIIGWSQLSGNNSRLDFDLVDTEGKIVSVQNPNIGNIVWRIVGRLRSGRDIDKRIGTFARGYGLAFMQIQSRIFCP